MVYKKVVLHLPPLNLLHLVRTNKFIRSILIKKSACQMWKTSFALLNDAPGCPTQLAEPKFALLLFEHFCKSKVTKLTS